MTTSEDNVTYIMNNTGAETWSTNTSTSILIPVPYNQKPNAQLFINVIMIVVFLLLTALGFIVAIVEAADGQNRRRRNQIRTRNGGANRSPTPTHIEDLTTNILELMTLRNTLQNFEQIDQLEETHRRRQRKELSADHHPPPPSYNNINRYNQMSSPTTIV